MGFGHRVYRAEDPRARVLRRTARRSARTRYEVAEALEKAALAELKARKPDRVLATNVEFWSAVVLDDADVPRELFTSHVHLRARRRVVGAHPRAEARGPADPADREVRRAAAAAARRRALTRASAIPRRRSPAHFISRGQDEACHSVLAIGAGALLAGSGPAAAPPPCDPFGPATFRGEVPTPQAGDRDRPRRARRDDRRVRRVPRRPSTPPRRASSPARSRASRSRAATCATRSSASPSA